MAALLTLVGADRADAGPTTIAVDHPTLGDHLGAAVKHFDKRTFLLALERSLRGTRKFDVVTRDQAKLDVLEAEQDFALSEESEDNPGLDGELLTVDLVAFPTITLFEFGSHHRPVPRLENRFHRRESGRLKVQVDVIESHSSRIIGSYTLSDSFSSKEAIVSGRQELPSSGRFLAMANAIGAALAEKVQDALKDAYPIMVITTSEDGELIYLNRGSNDGLAVDDKLTLFSKGEELIDPQTEEPLGFAEQELGEIKIVDVRPKVATATLVKSDRAEGDVTRKISKGDIARIP